MARDTRPPASNVCGKPDGPARKEAMKDAGGQSRSMSAVEAVVNVAVGYGVSVAATALVLPAFGLPVAAGQAAGIAGVFTIISLVRSYALRRLFNLIGQ